MNERNQKPQKYDVYVSHLLAQFPDACLDEDRRVVNDDLLDEIKKWIRGIHQSIHGELPNQEKVTRILDRLRDTKLPGIPRTVLRGRNKPDGMGECEDDETPPADSIPSDIRDLLQDTNRLLARILNEVSGIADCLP